MSAGELDAIVLDAAERAALVSIRSLGRAGVHAGALDDHVGPAFKSRWSERAAIVPCYVDDRSGYVRAVLEHVERSSAAVVIPVRDGSIDALRSERAAFEGIGLALAAEEPMEVAVDKSRTYAVARELGVPLARTVPLLADTDPAVAAEEVGLPAVVKPVRSWAHGAGTTMRSTLVRDLDELRDRAAAMRALGVASLLQQWVGGRREAVWLFYAQGRIWARFAQVAHRMHPPRGGSSIVRESVVPPTDVLESSERLVREIGLEGFSEVEFRRDAAGRANLMEINPRLSASIELAVRAGIDFPMLLYSWAAGRPLHQAQSYRIGVRMRWLGGDLRWLRSTLSSPVGPDIPPGGRAIGSFVRECFRPAAYDYVAASDPLPMLYASWDFARRGFAATRADKHASTGRPRP